MMHKYTEGAMAIGSLATFALLAEAIAAPSLGLVSSQGTGSHKDMNIFSLMVSISTLSPFFIEAAQQGMNWQRDNLIGLFDRLQRIGLTAEQKMYQIVKTNTHKGVLFLLLLLASATGIYQKSDKQDHIRGICNLAREIAKKRIEEELALARQKEVKELSVGLRAYRDFNLMGVRGEVLNTYKRSRKVGVPAIETGIKNNLHFNDVLIHCLISLMAENDDTTLLNRSYCLENIHEVRRKAKEILNVGSVFTPSGCKKIEDMDLYLNKKNMSPGGSADLVSCSVFLFFTAKQIKGREDLAQLLLNGTPINFKKPL